MPEMKSLTLNGTTYDNFVDQTARSAAIGSAIINSASGENITLTDASKFNLLELHIYGKTTQNGTPTLDAPVELESVGDSGSIIVDVTGAKESQSMEVVTPNGLPGIRVTSGGNYTDADGQQWICDEIDLARGVYVQRVCCTLYDGSSDESWGIGNAGNLRQLYIDPTQNAKPESRILCSAFESRNLSSVEGNSFTGTTGRLIFYTANFNTIDSWREYLSKNPMTVFYILAETKAHVLSEEELAAYAGLHTYRDNTVISNDASAHMGIEYVMDGKKYIDSLISSGGMSTARLTTITIRASDWSGSDSLYSQVVTVEGVTPNSKVDLLPSVEQLAIFHNKDVAFVTENENGVVTVYAIGDKPLLDYTMQAQITEVSV